MLIGEREYITISREYLLNGKTAIDFDVYLSVVSETGIEKEPQILIKAGTSPIALKSKLAGVSAKRLYILNEDFSVFKRYVESTINTIVADPLISIERKSRLVYECASNVMEDMYSNPRSGENLSRTRDVNDVILKFALGNDASIPSLLRLGSHDYYTFTHSINVAVFGIGLWNFVVGGSQEELRDFALGCILHDIGKTGIADTILNKPGKLENDEFETVKQHPVIGYELMKDSVSDVALDVILHHHERFDGTGYPEGLTGDLISDNAKIAAIADVYDALTTNRPYSDARKPFNAVLLMKEQMVGHFEQEKFIKFIYMLSGKQTN